jgi:hypothetical protein
VKVKNVSGQVVRCEWVPGGYVDADAVVDVPERQPDTVDSDGKTVQGDPLIWHPDIWEPVKASKAKAAADADEPKE